MIFQWLNQLKKTYPIVAAMKTENNDKNTAATNQITNNLKLSLNSQAANVFYNKGPVQIVGYGLPKLSFDSRHIILLNHHRNTPKTTLKHHTEDLTNYALDLDKMSPMQGR